MELFIIIILNKFLPLMGSYFSRSWSCDKGHKAVTPLSDGRVLVITVSPQIKAYSPLSRPYLITSSHSGDSRKYLKTTSQKCSRGKQIWSIKYLQRAISKGHHISPWCITPKSLYISSTGVTQAIFSFHFQSRYFSLYHSESRGEKYIKVAGLLYWLLALIVAATDTWCHLSHSLTFAQLLPISHYYLLREHADAFFQIPSNYSFWAFSDSYQNEQPRIEGGGLDGFPEKKGFVP